MDPGCSSGDMCAICGLDLNVKPSVFVSQGMSKLRESSVLRNDGLLLQYEAVETIGVHLDCRKKYISSYYINKCSSKKDSSAEASTAGVISRRSSLAAFDFKIHCLFCGEIANILTEKKEGS